ncbi:MAG TPA: SpoIIE family protein phosphatase [Planctomycetaceae bacterium]|nr:SpoIIE family protein phosphatase [Planctomycetaceae bacterium]
MPTLVLLQGGEAVPHELVNDETVIGRLPDCTIQLQSNMVSRRHARVVREGDRVFVEDMGSGNGTYVNGQRIEGRVELDHDDRIKLGPILLRFETERVPESEETLSEDGSSDDRRTVSDASGATVSDDDVSAAFRLQLAGGDDDSATIMGSVDNLSGFGLLETRPEAKLRGIVEITRSLAGCIDLKALLPRILDTLFSIFPQADRGSILLKDLASGRMIPAAQKHRRSTEDSTVRLSRTILNKVLTEKQGILSADAATDERFVSSESISSLTIRSMMCAPMLGLDGEPMGILNIDTQNPVKQFKEEDLDLLLAVAGQAALSYESARLLVSHVEKQKQDNEMRIARDVQRALLPETLPQASGYQFFASYDAAQAVGGDYYDAAMLGKDRIWLAFGDVAGKGVPGALLMSRISSVTQSTMRFTDDVGEAITAINNHMCSKSVEGRFVTYVLIVLDLRNHEMSLVNAGHMSPLIRGADGSVVEFHDETVGIPVGIIEDYPYQVVSRTLEPGETVVIVTDGVDEAMNPQGQLYTKERVVEFISQPRRWPAELVQALLADVRRHAAGRPQNDDITIMAFGRAAP